MHIPPVLLAEAEITEPLALDRLFADRRPVEVDIGCGKGRFLLRHAQANPELNLLGIDRQSVRLEKLARQVQRAGLTNVRLMYGEAAGLLERLLPPASVLTFYAFFPDPWPKRRHHPRRLFNMRTADLLCRALVPAGRVHVATDSADYCEVIRGLFASDQRLAAIEPFCPLPEERTNFENTFLGLSTPIHRCSWEKEKTLSLASLAGEPAEQVTVCEHQLGVAHVVLNQPVQQKADEHQ